MDERAQRIVESAMDLSERDGFDAVRLRDVASRADVALGTVYRRFKSKEDILLAGLELQAEKLRARLADRVMTGDTALARVGALFDQATQGLCRQPNLARALLRSLASADPDLVGKVAAFHSTITAMVAPALRGPVALAGNPSEDEAEIAFILQQVWFAALVGWAAGLHSPEEASRQVRVAASRMLNTSEGDR